MSAEPLRRPLDPPARGLLAAALTRASNFLIEPAEPAAVNEPAELRPHPVIAVVGSHHRAGATTVSRAIAAELASRSGRAAVVSCRPGSVRRGGPASRSAVRLAIALHGIAGADVRIWRRLCLVPSDDLADLAAASRYLAPVLLDVPADGSAAAAAAAADIVFVVGAASSEPSLAAALAATLPGPPVVVVNRATDAAWEGCADAVVPESRLGARAAMAGSRPIGALGRAIAGLADRSEP